MYLPRSKGVWGIRNLEMTYKATRIQATLRLLDKNEPKMKLVEKHDMIIWRKSVIGDGVKFACDDFKPNLT